MLERLGEIVPVRESHRLLTGYALALVGILAVGDGLRVIRFPLYTLGLPDTAAADAVVVVLGAGASAAAYRLARSTVGSGSEPVGDAALADGGDDTAGDPVEVLELRYARGEIDDTEYERRLEGLGADAGGADPTGRETAIADRDGLVDRETTIE